MALGDTTLDKSHDIGLFLGQQPVKPKSDEEDKPVKNMTAKYTKREVEQIKKTMIALGTSNMSEALKWTLEKMWEVHGEKIERIVKQKEGIESLD